MKKIIILSLLLLAAYTNADTIICNGTRSNTTDCGEYLTEEDCAEWYIPGTPNYPCEWTGSVCQQSATPCATTTTTSSTTSTSTTSTTAGTTTTTNTPSTTAIYTSTTFNYVLPNGNYGTLPSLNGSGGNTLNNGSIVNQTCTGNCVLGQTMTQFKLYIALFLTLIVLLSIKPFKLGALSSAICLDFFALALPGSWISITTAVALIYNFIAASVWFAEAEK